MKLRNKQTGEIATLTLSSNGEELLLMKNNEMVTRNVKLSDLEDWQDYEEPKGYWFIDCAAPYSVDFCEFNEDTEDDKQIGNYFETKEEAEKAVEKLKAWKRLKDVEFKLKGWYMPKNTLNIEIDGGFPKDVSLCDVMDDLDIIFGGEE